MQKKSYQVYVTTTVIECARYSVEADSPEHARQLHEEGKSTFSKDVWSETDSVDSVEIEEV